MVRKDAGFLKQLRIKEIKRQMAQTIQDGIDENKLLDWVEMNIGLTRETGKSYVDLIQRVEGWINVEGKIYYELPEG